MFGRKQKGILSLAVVILLIAITGIYFLISYRPESHANLEAKQETTNIGNTEKKIPSPSEIVMLPDSTCIYVLDKEKLDMSSMPKKRFKVTMDGDIFFNIPDRPGKFTVRTRLLKLTATGKAAFRVIAYSKDDGEEVQTLYGNIIAEKNYKSDFPAPETLRNNNLLMINRTIDLMEKEENQDTRELAQWKKTTGALKVSRYLQP
ncbi:hypothetical protein [Arcticibacter tournemirensis]